MKAKKVVYIIGAVICSTLAIVFRAAALPAKLLNSALEGMAYTANMANDQLIDNIKGKA